MNTYATGSALRRRDEILKLVRERPVRSQEELAGLLLEKGFSVAQPTLSRDIKDLGLVKTPVGYSPGFPSSEGTSSTLEKIVSRWEEQLVRVFRESVLSVQQAASLVVLKTPPAQAQLVAHVLDECPAPEWVGTIAGDDTVFVAISSTVSATNVAERFTVLIAQGVRSPRSVRRSP